MKKIAFSLGFICVVSFADNQQIVHLQGKESNGQVKFLAVGNPSFIKIEGVGKGANGNLAIEGKKAKGQFHFNLDSLDTGMDLRNEHMKSKYLQTNSFPESVLNIEDFVLKSDYDPKVGLGTGEFKGTLTLRGETRPVTCSYISVPMGNGKEKISAKFDLQLTDYKVDIPTFSGITVANKVMVEVESILEAAKEEAAR